MSISLGPSYLHSSACYSIHVTNADEGMQRYLHSFLTSALDGGKGFTSVSRPL